MRLPAYPLHRLARLCPVVLVLVVSVASAAGFTGETAGLTHPNQADVHETLDYALLDVLAMTEADDKIPVIVALRAQANLETPPGLARAQRLEKVIRALQAQSEASQRALRPLLNSLRARGQVSQIAYFWIFNGFSLSATPEAISELAARPEVLLVALDETIQGPEMPTVRGQFLTAAYEPNIGLINAPALWALGFRGQGVVIASMDTGVSLNHPDLVAQWRGGTNSWFDPYGQHPLTPTDVHGHGTWTMGVMVGRDTSGTDIGVAPDAQWIAVKIFNDQGAGTTSFIHLGFQWLLDPDGNPATADAPHVVNNSWVLGTVPACNLSLQPDLKALRAAGIIPVFAAGNFGPDSWSSASPANYPESLAVGNTYNTDQIYFESSRGPSACDETQSIFPELVAPGVDILTTDLGGLYTTATGTSMASPHVT
ncbi:MAG: S8 family serine peptidase, partial [Anaerolineae bacterium]|nr:S8 family serine peptidase [Anaerolineae bacterium]